MPFAFGHRFSHRRFKLGKTVASCRADVINLLEFAHFGELRRQQEQLFLGRNIDLVEHQPFALRPVFQSGNDLLDLWPCTCTTINDQRNQIGIARTVPGCGNHRAVEPSLRRKNAGGVDQDDLRFTF